MQEKSVEYVLAIWKCGSITKAAKELFVSQPSLSQYIHNLEQRLGARLFDRTTTPIQLTDAGRIYVKYATQILENYKQMERDIRRLSYSPWERIAVGASPYIFFLMAPIVSEFKQTHPSVSISLKDGLRQQRQQFLLNGEIDILFTPRRFDDPRIKCHKTLNERILLALPPTHQLVTSETLRYQEEVAIPAMYSRDYSEGANQFENDFPLVSLMNFRDESFLMTKTNGSLRQSAITLCRQIGFEPKVVLDNISIEAALSFTIRQIGISFVPETVLRFYKPNPSPVYFRIKERPFSRDLYIAYSKANPSLSLISEFADVSARILTSAATP